MKRFVPFCLVLTCLIVPAARGQEKPLVLDLWKVAVPGGNAGIGEEKFLDPNPKDKKPVKRLTNITKPTLTVYRPAKDKDTGAAVVIAPGGGFNILAWDLEGEEVAAWLNSIGVTGIVLKYRVPRRASDPKDGVPVGALQDAQRAMSLVRSKASEWNLDAKRIGMLGFSAGGHLTAALCTNYEKRAYDPYDLIESVDQVSCRPDFGVLIYPGGMLEKGNNQLREAIRVTKDTPPCFFAHASNDPVTPENSAVMYLALKRANVPAELHIYATGGHGFGLRPSDNPCSTWPKRCEEWMRNQKIVK
jgi:acetyl esterase/lipase